MPIKSPDVWAQIWEWLVINWASSQFSGAIASFVMVILRVLYQRKKNKFRYTVLDGLICASFVHTAVPVIEHWFPNTEWAPFFGMFIGFIGTDKLREFLFKFVNTQIDKGQPYGNRQYGEDDTYGESKPNERD